MILISDDPRLWPYKNRKWFSRIICQPCSFWICFLIFLHFLYYVDLHLLSFSKCRCVTFRIFCFANVEIRRKMNILKWSTHAFSSKNSSLWNIKFLYFCIERKSIISLNLNFFKYRYTGLEKVSQNLSCMILRLNIQNVCKVIIL